MRERGLKRRWLWSLVRIFNGAKALDSEMTATLALINDRAHDGRASEKIGIDLVVHQPTAIEGTPEQRECAMLHDGEPLTFTRHTSLRVEFVYAIDAPSYQAAEYALSKLHNRLVRAARYQFTSKKN